MKWINLFHWKNVPVTPTVTWPEIWREAVRWHVGEAPNATIFKMERQDNTGQWRIMAANKNANHGCWQVFVCGKKNCQPYADMFGMILC